MAARAFVIRGGGGGGKLAGWRSPAPSTPPLPGLAIHDGHTLCSVISLGAVADTEHDASDAQTVEHKERPTRRQRRRRRLRSDSLNQALPASLATSSAFVPSLSPSTPALPTLPTLPAWPRSSSSTSSLTAAPATAGTLALMRMQSLVRSAPTGARKAVVHFLSGGLAAGLVRASLQPLDTAKTRLQAAKSVKHSVSSVSARYGISVAAVAGGAGGGFLGRRIGHVARTVLDGKGIPGLYKGVVPGVTGIVPAAAVYMLVFQTLKSKLSARTTERWRNVAVASSAALGDVAASLVRVPCEVAKQRLQVGVYSNAGDALRSMLANGGIRSIYTGLGAQLARDVPFAAAEFVMYENLKAIVLQRSAKSRGHAVGESIDTNAANLTKAQSLIVGGGSGIVAAVVSNPSDVVKTRLMTQVGAQRRYRSIGHAFQKILADEGVGAFAKGLAPRMAAKALQSACFFTTYELLRRTLANALDVDMSSKSKKNANETAS